jgi:hypothetical protein
MSLDAAAFNATKTKVCEELCALLEQIATRVEEVRRLLHEEELATALLPYTMGRAYRDAHLWLQNILLCAVEPAVKSAPTKWRLECLQDLTTTYRSDTDFGGVVTDAVTTASKHSSDILLKLVAYITHTAVGTPDGSLPSPTEIQQALNATKAFEGAHKRAEEIYGVLSG